jgi:hypothetical protein
MDFSSSLNFTDVYIESVLQEQGVTLTDEQKDFYLPQLSTMAEKHVGAALMGKLTADQLAQFEELFASDTTTGEEWNSFWKKSIPEFGAVVEVEMKKFAEKVRAILAETA